MSDKGDPIECHLCFKTDFWQKHEVPEEEECGLLGMGSGESIPADWCHDYHDEGGTIYFCSKQHRNLWQRAKYLSWQAVALLKEFAKTLRT